MAGARCFFQTIVTLGGMWLMAMPSAQGSPSGGMPTPDGTEWRGAEEPPQRQRMVVRWKSGQAPSRSGPLATRALPFHGATAPWLPMQLVREHAQTQVYAWTQALPRAVALSEAQRLMQDPRVERADLDQWVEPHATDFENDSRLQWHRGDSSIGGVGADAVLWARTTGQGVNVAVVDTGVMPTPDLAPLAAGYDLVSLDAGSLDGDGWDADPGPDRQLACGYGWHGTFVASVIGAQTGNGRGTAGIAPGAQLVPVRALSSCGGWASDTAFAMAWAAGVPVTGAPRNPSPARVINASFGRVGACESYEQEAIDQALARGAVVVASAGNGGTAAVTAPANCQGVVAVTATTFERKRAQYANTGSQVWIAAPGGGTAFDGTPGSALYSSGVNAQLQAVDAQGANGTSLSAPVVSGVLALMLASRPYATVEELKTALRSSAQPFPAGSGCDTGCGAGVVNAPAAVAAIEALSPMDRAALPQGTGAVANGAEASDSAARNPTGGGAMSALFLAGLALAVMAVAGLRRWTPTPAANAAAAMRSTRR